MEGFMTLHMLELRLDLVALLRFALDQGIDSHRDEDLGYNVHAWLAALLGKKAPKPFRLLLRKNGRHRLLGYTCFEGTVLRDYAESFALPLTAAITHIEDLNNTKPMPMTWRQGRRLGFEVLVCPTSRRDGKEKDRYSHLLERLGSDADQPSRESCYLEWLGDQFDEAATIEAAHLEKFQFVSHYRRGMKIRKLERPQALFRGVCTVDDPNLFQRLLRRGIGRHRAFGYGMLLIGPV